VSTKLGLNRHKTCPTGQGVGPASHPLGSLGLGFGPLGPCVKYTPVVMMILIFGQLHFLILEMLQFGTYVHEIK
jgi:hypothetical protein